MADDAFKALLQAQAANENGGGGKGKQSFPLLAVFGFRDAKLGTLGAISSNTGYLGSADVFGFGRETWMTKVIKGGFKNSGESASR